MADEKESVATFRFGVIAPLVCRRFENKAQEKEVRKEILTKPWTHPDGGVRGISGRTLRHWLWRYRKFGLDGLYDRKRQASALKGRCEALSKELVDEAERLRREVSSRSVRTIVSMLANNFPNEAVCERTLARQLKQRRATKEQVERGDGYFQRWEQIYANDMWQGDTAHGVWLPDPKNPGKAKKTKLIVFIDDATRVVTHAEFYFDEQLASMIDTFSKALIARGKPARLLLDNAFIYHSNTLASMCMNLEIELAFCRPRRPQGKGKIERWIRSCKGSFYPEASRAGVTNLAELNALFKSWLQKRYHEKVHEELGTTPLVRWQKDVCRIRSVDESEIHRALMLRVRRRVHVNTATVTLEGEEYQVSPPYTGGMVEVRWHPNCLDNVEIWLEGTFVEIAHRVVRHAHVQTKKFDVGEEADYQPLASSKKYFEAIGSEVGTKFASTARSHEILSLDEFQELVSACLQRAMHETEKSRLRTFFAQFAPLNREITEDALLQAADAKGMHLHLRFYLQHLEQVVQNNRRTK